MTERTVRFITAAIVGISLTSCGGGASNPALPAPPAGSSVTLSPGPTPTPTVSPVPSPTLSAACTIAAAVAGTYTSIASAGNITGNAYAQNVGSWNAVLYTAATPVPVPTPTMTPAPTPPPVPTPTPTPVTYLVYAGTYAVPAFSATGSHGPYTTNATNGCLFVITRADGLPIVALPASNTVAAGSVPITAGDNVSSVGNGAITTFSITGLGPSSGNATFTLDNGTQGAGTIQSSQLVTAERARRMLDQMQRVSVTLGDGRRR